MPVVVVPAAALLLVAVLCLLLLLAWEQFAQALNNVVPAWHVPGLGSFRGWITSHIREGYNAVAGYLDQRVRPFGSFIMAPIIVLTRLFDELGAVGHDLYVLAYRIITITIPRAVRVLRAETVAVRLMLVAFVYAKFAQAEAFTMEHIHAARAYAQSLAAAAEAYALTKFAQAEAFTMEHIHAARSYALALATAVEARALDRLHVAEVYTAALVNAARAEAARLYSTAMATIEARYQAARVFATQQAKAEAAAMTAAVNHALITDIGVPWAAAAEAVEGVAGVAEGAFTDVVGDLRHLVHDMPRDVPAAVAMTLGIAVPLLKLTRDCTIPNCKNLSKVGRDLQDLFGVLEGGLFLELLFDAATDPEGTAGAVVDTVGSTVRDIASAILDEIH